MGNADCEMQNAESAVGKPKASGACQVRAISYNRGMDNPLLFDRELDIRGEVCPYTFVKTRLALEEMQPGEVLRVLVDHEPATKNVPRSVKVQGDEVLSVEPCGASQWAITVRKVTP